MWNKVIIIGAITAFMALLGFITTLSVWNHNLGKENGRLKAQVANLNTLIDTQNKQILQDKIDIEAYQNAQPKVQEKIITKYQVVETIKGNTQCEKELNTIKKALRIYYER